MNKKSGKSLVMNDFIWWVALFSIKFNITITKKTIIIPVLNFRLILRRLTTNKNKIGLHCVHRPSASPGYTVLLSNCLWRPFYTSNQRGHMSST